MVLCVLVSNVRLLKGTHSLAEIVVVDVGVVDVPVHRHPVEHLLVRFVRTEAAHLNHSSKMNEHAGRAR